MEELDENTTQKLLTVIPTWSLTGPIINFKLKPLYVVFRHSGAMKAFCVKYGVFASIQGLEGVAELYRISDGYLSDYMKKRIQIKPDGHCLPRAVFNGLKRKGFWSDHHNYKELFRDAIFDIKYNDIYRTGMSDSKEEVFRCLAEYQNEKIYP